MRSHAHTQPIEMHTAAQLSIANGRENLPTLPSGNDALKIAAGTCSILPPATGAPPIRWSRKRLAIQEALTALRINTYQASDLAIVARNAIRVIFGRFKTRPIVMMAAGLSRKHRHKNGQQACAGKDRHTNFRRHGMRYANRRPSARSWLMISLILVPRAARPMKAAGKMARPQGEICYNFIKDCCPISCRAKRGPNISGAGISPSHQRHRT